MIYKRRLISLTLAASALLTGCQTNDNSITVKPETVRFATFNVAFDRNSYEELVTEMKTLPDQQGESLQQTRNIAEILQRVRPDVVLLNEFNNDGMGTDMEAINGFKTNYLAISQHGADPINYPYAYNFATNTGKQTKGMDLDKDGNANGGPDDALGFGAYHGQYAFTVLSKYPLDTANMRTFQHFKWKDIRANNPVIPNAESCNRAKSSAIKAYCLNNVGKPWYTDFEWENMMLSAKNHVDLPIKLPNNKTVHFLISHPTPSIFDNPVMHNTLRNLDEVQFWNDYVSGNQADSTYIYDDNKKTGGLATGESFIIAGDMNSDPQAGDGKKEAIRYLLSHERVNHKVTGNNSPVSNGAIEYYKRGIDSRNTPYPERMTNTSNLHLDYVVPSADLKVSGTGVFWPAAKETYSYLVQKEDCQDLSDKMCYDKPVSSDHRLVWLDIDV